MLVAAGGDDGFGGEEDGGGGSSVGAIDAAFELNRAGVFADDALRDPQAEAGAAFALGGEEGLEEVVADFGGDSGTVIGNLDDGSGFQPMA